MRKTITTKLALIIVIIMMISLTSCELFAPKTTTVPEGQRPVSWNTSLYTEDRSFGEGAKTFTLKVEADGYSVTFTIYTDAETVGEALIAHNLIAGEDSQYGLYVKKVNGILADYDVDQTYWAFYENGEYAMSGVDTTTVTDGANYSFVRSK